MAMGIWLPGGGGADVDVVTAEAGDVLEGKVIVGPDGEPLTGTLALSGNAADSQVLSGQTYYNTDAKTKRTGSMSNQGAWTSRLGANGKVTIPAGYHNGAGYVDQALPAKGAATYTPGRSNQTIGAGQYLTGAQTIRGDANLLAANIKKGVSIFGVEGEWEGIVSSPYYLWQRGSFRNGQSMTFGHSSYVEGDHLHLYNAATFNNFVDLTNHKYIKFVAKSFARSSEAKVTVINVSTGSTVAEGKINCGTNAETTGFVNIEALQGQCQIVLSPGLRSSTVEVMYYYEVFLSNQ